MKKFFTKILAITLFSFVCLPAFVFAGVIDNTDPTTPPNPNIIQGVITNPLRIGSDIPSIITAVLENIVMPLASVLVVLAILYSGFKFVIAQGAPKEIQEARQGLVWVLVGTLILLGAVGISKALQATVNSIVK